MAGRHRLRERRRARHPREADPLRCCTSLRCAEHDVGLLRSRRHFRRASGSNRERMPVCDMPRAKVMHQRRGWVRQRDPFLVYPISPYLGIDTVAVTR